MPHIFIELKGIKPGIETPADLSYVLRDDKHTVFSMSATVVEWIKGTVDFAGGQPLTKLKNCCFAFDDGKEFIEFDSKGKVKPSTTVTPDWFPDCGKFMREQWLKNNEMYDLPVVDFIKTFLDTFDDVKDRRRHCDLLFDLHLDQVKISPVSDAHPPAGKMGNKNRLTTQPKIHDLNSFDIFDRFFERLAETVEKNQFPTMQILTGYENLNKAPTPLKGAMRTWFRAITGELPPNNKRVDAGNSALFCAPIRTTLQQIRQYGKERYYGELSQAIQQAGELTLDKFTFRFPR